MLTQLIWWTSIALEILLLFKGFRAGLASRYRIFYTYIGFVLWQSLLRRAVMAWFAPFYSSTYWSTEFLGVILGSAVVFEIYRVGLEPYPGTARMARAALWFVFLAACGEGFVNTAGHRHWWRRANVWELERNLRAFQALAIAALLVLFLIYSIRFGKNLNGILLGYSLFVGVSIFQLTFVSPAGHWLSDFWSYVHPISYDVALAIWLGHLWSYQQCPDHSAAGFEVSGGYRRMAALTQRRLQETRGYLRKATGS
jgi:hypothetical protein